MNNLKQHNVQPYTDFIDDDIEEYNKCTRCDQHEWYLVKNDMPCKEERQNINITTYTKRTFKANTYLRRLKIKWGIIK